MFLSYELNNSFNQKNGEAWVLDVRFTKQYNVEESFASNTDKYY